MADESFPSTAVIRETWCGFANVKHLIIFGASYCDVGYDHKSPHPTHENPLGVEFPGFTYAEPEEPNWVGHLITKYSPSPNLLVYNYAKGGSRVYNVKNQVERQFLEHAGKKPDWAPWNAQDTIFSEFFLAFVLKLVLVTWVGINDAAFGQEHEENVVTLFNIQETLYAAGARNFLFINIPPIHRSPAGVRANPTSFINWNTELSKSAQTFSVAHRDATVMIFSSWETFNRVLDDPVSYGFPVEDVQKQRGSIWIDHLHPTSKMHDIIARDLGTFLVAQPPFSKADIRSAETPP